MPIKNKTDISLLSSLKASWIWPFDQKDIVNQYVEFRHEFLLATPDDDAQLAVSVDSNYAVWVNGRFVDTGQFPDYPANKTCDFLPVGQYLQSGKNVLAILAHYCGEGHFSYIKGRPALIYALKSGDTAAVSGRNAFYRSSPCFHQGPIPKITQQMPFTFEFNAIYDDGWQSPDYQINNRWTSISDKDIVTADHKNVLQPRPVKKLERKPKTPVSIVAQGVFKRCDAGKKTVAELMQTDFLSPRCAADIFKNTKNTPVQLAGGIEINLSSVTEKNAYMVVDLGREDAGYIQLEMDASAGTVIDFAFGEHLNDLRVRSAVDGRNFASRYICKEGRQSFTYYFTRFGLRYIQLHISGLSEKFTLYYAGLIPAEYPVEEKGRFDPSDKLHKRIYEVGVRTLHLCMHEHYEDTPWREQALYANDARNQAIGGYYCFGEYQFPKVSLSLLGDSLKDDGYLELCAPAEISITIPAFSMAWFLGLSDYLLFSGDVDFIKSRLAQVEKMLNRYLASLIDGLLPVPDGDRFWHFYDWAAGFDGANEAHTALIKPQTIRFDAPLNLFLCMALEAGSFLEGVCGNRKNADNYKTCADKLRETFRQNFWNAKTHAYKTYLGKNTVEHFAELTQALAICAGACPDETADSLIQMLVNEDNCLVKTSTSQSLYKFEAILKDKEKYGQWVFDAIAKDWGNMLFAGATSFWETLKGAWDFNNAGSLCHGWSAIPVYFYQAYLLGIKPIEPGFTKFSVAPAHSNIAKTAGSVPTPFGLIKLSWRQTDDGIIYDLSYPKGTYPVFPNSTTKDTINLTCFEQ